MCLVIDSFLTLNSSSDPRGIFVSQMSARILSRYFGRLRAVSLFSLSVEQTPEDLESLFCLIRDVISYNVKLAGSSSFSLQLFFYYLERGSHLGLKRTGGGVNSNRPLPRYKNSHSVHEAKCKTLPVKNTKSFSHQYLRTQPRSEKESWSNSEMALRL